MTEIPPDVQKILRDPHFGALKHFIITSTGLSYYQDKDPELAAAIHRAMDRETWTSAGAYLGKISAPESEAMDRLAEELTIGETFFFRHTEVFTSLRDRVFPQLHERKQPERRLRIWSAGCSVGAEPYSLSILLRTDLSHLFHDWRLEIIGTDINRRFLKTAQAATFEPWALRGLSESLRDRCFTPSDKKWVLHEAFTKGVTFLQHNLVRDPFPSLANHLFGFDLIICRNVMIYFNAQTVRRLAGQFEQTLLPGGWLVVGHAEPHTETFSAFETINVPGAVLYHRATSPSPAPVFQSRPLPAHPNFSRLGATPPPTGSAARLPSVPRWEPPPPEASPGIARIRELADAGQAQEALRLCERELVTRHLNAELYLIHALLLEQQGQASAAQESLHRCVYLDREMVLAHYHLGVVRRRLHHGAEAARSFRNAEALLQTTPDNALVPYGDGLTAGDLRHLIAHETKKCS